VAGVDACWICKGTFAKPFVPAGDTVMIDCTTCGIYVVAGSAFASEDLLSETTRYRLSYWCKQRQLDGGQPPRFDSYSTRDIVSGLPNPATSEKPDRLLISLGKKWPEPGTYFRIDHLREYSLSCARNVSESTFHMRALIERGQLNLRHSDKHQMVISSDGWRRIDELRNQPVTSRKAFVAMRFNTDMLPLFASAFKPAIEAAGYEAIRSGDPDHNERIDARIMVDIMASKFLVADFTYANQGVYFEAGYALGLGRPVIWTCREDRMDQDRHFDTTQYNHVVWRDADDLMPRLRDRIIATI